MKSNSHIVILILAFVCLMAAPQKLLAFGFGAAGSVGVGTLEKNDGIFSNQKTSYSENREAIGLLYDTNIGQDRLFNYRLGISYLWMKATSADKRYDLNGVSFDNDFGFGLVRNESVRVWVGPELKVEILTRKFHSDFSQETESTLGMGLGPVAGVNIDLGSDMALSLKGGYIFLVNSDIFSDWNERFGFFSVGVIFKMGEDKKVGKEALP